jgi:hypothetical protein
MVGYRCYILDAEDHIVQPHDFDCETDAQAEAMAEALLRSEPYHRAVEVWKSTRRVVKMGHDRTVRPPRLLRVVADSAASQAACLTAAEDPSCGRR